MKDSELQFDRTCHVLYSKPCKRQIREKSPCTIRRVNARPSGIGCSGSM